MRTTALALTAASLAACMPGYHYQTANPLSARRGCAQLVHASADWNESFGDGDYIYTTSHDQQGVAFDRDGEHVDVRRALLDLHDPELVAAYGKILDHTDHDAIWYPRYRAMAFGMAGGALGASLLMLVQVIQAGGNMDTGTLMTETLAVTGLALASIVPTILASHTYKGAVEHDIEEHMIIDEGVAERADGDVAKCGVQ